MNKKKKKDKNKDEIKNNKDISKKFSKKIIIICSVLLFLVLLGIGLFVLYKYRESKKPIEQEWGQTYYMYLKDVNEKNKQKDAGLPNNLKTSKLNFYEVDAIKDPVMVIDYKNDGNNYSNVYFINNNKVNVMVYNQPSEIELLYNIENKKYDYYSHIKDNDTNRYKSIAEQINERLKELEKSKNNNSSDNKQSVEESTEYSFGSDSVDKVVDVNGKEISLNKFDQTFVKTDVVDKGIDYNFKLDEGELKNVITEKIKEYKTTDEKITKSVETSVKKKIEKMESTKKEMETAKEEVAKKEAEEKAKKEAEEKARQEREGFKVGSYIIKYGRYEWDLAEVGDPGRKDVYILRSDKTCTHIDFEGKTTSCTFRAGRATDGQSIESMVERDALIINDGQYDRSYFPKTNGFRDTDLENFLYKGSN